MRFGPHTQQVDDLLAALVDPAVRRSPGRRCRYALQIRPDLENATYRLVRVAGRLDEWDDARMTAARIAVPSQADSAASADLAIVASDLIDDRTWDHFTAKTPLACRIEIPRPGGPLAERCACGMQLGQRLVAAKAQRDDQQLALWVPPCLHTTPGLPTPEALGLAFGLVQAWESSDWGELVEAAQLLAI